MSSSVARYGMALLLVGVALAVSVAMLAVDQGRIFYVFIPAVAAAGRFGGKGPGLVALIASALALDYFIVPPIYAFGPSPEYMFRFILFLVCALLVGLISVPYAPARPSPDVAAGFTHALTAATMPTHAELRAKKILIMGLAGAGKTTLANALVRRLKAVHFNGDDVREHIDKELGFSHDDRVEHAKRMGWLCDRVVAGGAFAVADFICPTVDTRQAFGDAFVVWVDRIASGRFADTNAMFQQPARYDVRVGAEGTAESWAEQICDTLLSLERMRRPS